MPSVILPPKPQFHIAIVGAGLGGLAAAISIAKAGHRATILEQAAALGEVCEYHHHLLHLLTSPGRRRYSNPTQLIQHPQTLGHP